MYFYFSSVHLPLPSFEAGLTRTARGKLDGGDTAWEEKAGQKYSTSEVRLVEITEELCRSGRLEAGLTQSCGACQAPRLCDV